MDSQVSLVIPDPGRATWYIGVYGWSTCEYTLAAFESSRFNFHLEIHVEQAPLPMSAQNTERGLPRECVCVTLDSAEWHVSKVRLPGNFHVENL